MHQAAENPMFKPTPCSGKAGRPEEVTPLCRVIPAAIEPKPKAALSHYALIKANRSALT